jgi:hypothetical protein
VPELLGLRSGSLASEYIAALPINSPHVVVKTGEGAAASADIEIKFSGFQAAAAASPAGAIFGACVLGNGSLTSGSGIGVTVSRAFLSWNLSILTEIYLCHACSYHKIQGAWKRPDR